MNSLELKTKIEYFNKCLRKNGLKSTHQRNAVASVFFSQTAHVSLEELHLRVRKKYPRVGFATVYRTVKLLSVCGLAVESRFGEGQSRYENVPEDGHHDHLICIKCSKISEFHNQKIEDLQAETAKKFHFKVVRHKLELYGYCKDCI